MREGRHGRWERVDGGLKRVVCCNARGEIQWAGLCRPSAELGAAAGGEPEAAAAMDMFADPDCDF